MSGILGLAVFSLMVLGPVAFTATIVLMIAAAAAPPGMLAYVERRIRLAEAAAFIGIVAHLALAAMWWDLRAASLACGPGAALVMLYLFKDRILAKQGMPPPK